MAADNRATPAGSGPAHTRKGTPAEGYPSTWGVYRWLEGENPAPGTDPRGSNRRASTAGYPSADADLVARAAPAGR